MHIFRTHEFEWRVIDTNGTPRQSLARKTRELRANMRKSSLCQSAKTSKKEAKEDDICYISGSAEQNPAVSLTNTFFARLLQVRAWQKLCEGPGERPEARYKSISQPLPTSPSPHRFFEPTCQFRFTGKTVKLTPPTTLLPPTRMSVEGPWYLTPFFGFRQGRD